MSTAAVLFILACIALSIGLSATAFRADRPLADDQRASITAGQLEVIAAWVDEQLLAQNADGHYIAACAAEATRRIAAGLEPAQAGRVYRSRPAWMRLQIKTVTRLLRLTSLQARKAN